MNTLNKANISTRFSHETQWLDIEQYLAGDSSRQSPCLAQSKKNLTFRSTNT